MVKEIQTEEFESEIKNNEIVLLEFYGTWCMPCKMLSGILDKVNETLENKINILKIDVDSNVELVKKYGVLTTPTLIVVKNGEEMEKAVGFRQEKQILELVKKYM